MSQDAPPVIYAKDGVVATLTLNRPDRLNAVSLPLYEAMTAALQDLADDRSVRAAVVTGAGRAFCAGADLKSHGAEEPTADERRRYVWTAQRASYLIQTCPKPVVAAVNGHAIGAGLELALACDFIIVANDAKLRLPEATLGTFVGGGSVTTLPARVGVARAKELVLLGEFFSGEEAAAMGLANRAVPTDRVVETALEWARRLAARAPISLKFAKRLLNRARHLDPRRAMALEARALLACMATRDWKEGIRAFHEKRDPHFTGE